MKCSQAWLVPLVLMALGLVWGCEDGGPPPPLVVTPTSATIAPGENVTFQIAAPGDIYPSLPVEVAVGQGGAFQVVDSVNEDPLTNTATYVFTTQTAGTYQIRFAKLGISTIATVMVAAPVTGSAGGTSTARSR